MNTQEIYSLLEKYYEGRCSDEEEQALMRYFREEEVPPEIMAEKELFNSYVESFPVPEPDSGFEQRIISSLDREIERRNRKATNRFLYAVMSAAAALLLLVGSWYFFIRRTEPADTFKDPVLAYNETVKILYNVSSRMNEGLNAMEPARKAQSIAAKNLDRVGKSTGLLDRNLKSLDYFTKAIDIVSSPLEHGTLKK